MLPNRSHLGKRHHDGYKIPLYVVQRQHIGYGGDQSNKVADTRGVKINKHEIFEISPLGLELILQTARGRLSRSKYADLAYEMIAPVRARVIGGVSIV